MLGSQRPNSITYRDGTGQEQRALKALDPAYALVDERTMEDLLEFAQQLAPELRYIDEEALLDPSTAPKDWMAFMVGNMQQYTSLDTEDEKALYRKQWVAEILSYCKNPENFANNPDKLARLSQPHLALFVTFLRLLGHVREQLNTVTAKHLDFYYRDVLGLTKKAARPDRVNVVAELASDATQYLLPQGTLLDAGKDQDGNDLVYQTDADIVLNQSSVASLRTVFVEKKTVDIPIARTDNMDDGDGGFLRMVQQALGDPNPGDDLPPFPAGADSFEGLLNWLEKGSTSEKSVASTYIATQLFMSAADYVGMMSIHTRDMEPNSRVEDDDWEKVYALLGNAYKSKREQARRETLRVMREQEPDSATGFLTMLEFALGEPKESDPMPDFGGQPGNVQEIYQILKGTHATRSGAEWQTEARNYVRDELFLTEDEFDVLAETAAAPAAMPEEWAAVYASVERAQRKKRNFAVPVPTTEEWLNIYKVEDTTAGPTNHWKLFGESQTIKKTAVPGDVGFALTTPLLDLCEGTRDISVYLQFQADTFDQKRLAKALQVPGDNPTEFDLPFDFFFSTEKEWLVPQQAEIQLGTYVVHAPLAEYSATYTASTTTITKTSGPGFDDKDVGRYMVMPNGSIYQVLAVSDAANVKVRKAGTTTKTLQTQKFAPEGICFNCLRIHLVVDKSQESLAPRAEPEQGEITSNYPVLRVVLRNFNDQRGGQTVSLNRYQQFMDLELERAVIKVAVSDIREFELQNDSSTLNSKKPFEPFGTFPEKGARWFIWHPELVAKRLDSLTLGIDWMSVPHTELNKWYANYWKIQQDNHALPESSWPITANTDFQARIGLFDNSALLDLGTVALFAASDATKTNTLVLPDIPATVAKNNKNYRYTRQLQEEDSADITDRNRYIQLELSAHSFYHEAYNQLFTRQAMSGSAEVKKLEINPPYTPKVKSMTLGYTSQVEIGRDTKTSDTGDQLHHLEPFGHHEVLPAGVLDEEGHYHLLPQFKNEGELYIGIANAVVPQNLSLLFQLAEGTADPDVLRPDLSWAILSGNHWQSLDGGNVLHDGTAGLLNTGIVTLNLPEEGTTDNTLMPAGMHWIRVAAPTRSEGASDAMDIIAQAVPATFLDQENSGEHLANVLPPETIQGAIESIPELNAITQPFPSEKGKPAEREDAFYTRVSERLRHKNRALTMWDYERLVLENFPGIYKVKCLPADLTSDWRQTGNVDVIVIPDIRGKLPFDPFEPKVPADQLQAIQTFLEALIPPYAALTVKNPQYVQVKTRFAVRFNDGLNPGFYRQQLDADIKEFLAPWAYDNGSDIVIGGNIYANVIVNFIAERPYVDYIARIKLFQSNDGERFVDARILNDGKNVVTAHRPDVILVSARNHEIDLISARGYEDDDFTGINYMHVELDFQVSPEDE